MQMSVSVLSLSLSLEFVDAVSRQVTGIPLAFLAFLLLHTVFVF